MLRLESALLPLPAQPFQELQHSQLTDFIVDDLQYSITILSVKHLDSQG
jgi:hypothetical protein